MFIKAFEFVKFQREREKIFFTQLLSKNDGKIFSKETRSKITSFTRLNELGSIPFSDTNICFNIGKIK